jgi:hypothetical protein
MSWDLALWLLVAANLLWFIALGVMSFLLLGSIKRMMALTGPVVREGQSVAQHVTGIINVSKRKGVEVARDGQSVLRDVKQKVDTTKRLATEVIHPTTEMVHGARGEGPPAAPGTPKETGEAFADMVAKTTEVIAKGQALADRFARLRAAAKVAAGEAPANGNGSHPPTDPPGPAQ